MSAGTAPGMLVWMPSNSGAPARPFLGDERAPIAALRHILRVAKALHQHGPGARDALGVPAGRGRLARKPVARHRRNHEVEGVRCARAMRRWIGQRIDDLQLLDDRAGPPVRDDERQRILMFRTNVDEMNVEPVDVRHELRQGVQPRFDLAPVVICRPIGRELAHRRELHALRRIRYRFPLGPLCRGDPPAEIGESLIGGMKLEGADRVVFSRCARGWRKGRRRRLRRLLLQESRAGWAMTIAWT